MIPDDIQALVLADAIGALDPDERRDLEVRLAALPSSARAEVAYLYDASVEIAASASGEEPSPGVRDALLGHSCRAGQPHHHRHRWRMGRDLDARLADEDPRDRPRTGSSYDAAQGRAGAPYPAHRHSGPEECYVISGSPLVEGRVLRAGDFHYAEGASDHGEQWTDEGVEVLLVASASDYLG